MGISLQSVRIRNVGDGTATSLRDVHLEANAINVLQGVSGSAKTLITELLELNVRGQTPRLTNAAGGLLGPLLIPGCTDGDITSVWKVGIGTSAPREHTIVTTITPDGLNVTLDGRGGVRADVQRRIFALFGVTAAQAAVQFGAIRFAELGAKDRAAFLAAVSGGGYDIEQVKAEAAKLGPVALEIWGDRATYPQPLNWDKTLNKLTSERAAERSRIKAHQQILDLTKPAAPMSDADIAALKADIASLDAQIELTKLPAIGDGNQAAAVATLEAELAKCAVPPDPTAQLDALVASKKQMAAAGGKCPMMPTVSCSAVTPAVIEAELQRLDALAKTFADAKDKRDDTQARLTTARALLDRTRRDRQHRDAERARLLARLAPREEITADALPAAREQLGVLTAKLSQALNDQSVQAKWDEANATVTQCRVREAALDALVEAYGPTGWRKTLATPNAFAETVQKFIPTLFPEVEPGYLLDLEAGTFRLGNGTTPIPVSSLSHGQAQRLGVAVQIGVAEATGFALFVFDEFESLDATTKRKVLLSLLSFNLQRKYGTTFLCSPPAPREDWQFPALEKRHDVNIAERISYFRVGGGKVEQL